MSPARKRATKSAKKTTKKPTRKASAKKAPTASAKKAAKAGAKKKAPAKKAPAKKAERMPAGKTEKREVKKTAAKRRAPASPPRSSGKAGPKPAKATRRDPKAGFAQPLESASRRPGLGAKWACFSCGAKFYDLNRPDPICPKCQTDQRDQPAKSAVAPTPPPIRQPATPPITRLLDEEETPDARFDDDADAEAAAELDLGKLDDEYLDDADFSDDSDD